MKQKKFFEEYNYEKRKSVLPEGYEPLEFITTKTHTYKPIRYVHVGWYRNEKDLLKRIGELHHKIPFIKFSVDKQLDTPISYKYGFYAPDIVCSFLENGEEATLAVIKKEYNDQPYCVYRQIGKDPKNIRDYVGDALNNGSLLISTFEKFRKLESDRCDKYEQRNIIEIHGANGLRAELDVMFDFDCLVLCTALPSYDDFKDKKEWIKINNVSGFIEELTKVLIKNGIEISEVLFGNCVYGNKRLSMKNDELVNRLLENPFYFSNPEINSYVVSELSNDIIMNKPEDFKKEKEFRIVFKLVNRIDNLKVSEAITILADGIIVTDKALAKYFEKVE